MLICACVRQHVLRLANRRKLLTFKMAPWPEQGNEPKAPDKTSSKIVENSPSETLKASSGGSEDFEVCAASIKTDDKQTDERNPDVLNLDDGQLRALLDEAITYKRPKDREGKSELFRELLQEAEADETECGDGRRGLAGSGAGGSRYYSNSSRRRGRRDAAVSERPTRGGSLQNLVHASNSEFDTSFGGSSHGGRRKSKRSGGGGAGSLSGGRDCGVNVSARQREGGSLPSNVNVGGMLSGLEYHHPSLPFEEVRFSSKQAKRKDPLVHTVSSNDFGSMPVHVSAEVNSSSSPESGGRQTGNTARYLMAPKSECMVIDLGNCAGSDDEETPSSALDEGDKRNGAEEEGTELEVLQRAEVTARVPNYTSHATLEVGLGDIAKKTDALDVDSTLRLLQQCEKSGVVNGVEQTHIQLSSSYNSVKCFTGSTASSRDDRIVATTGRGSEVSRRGGDISRPAGAVMNMYPMQHHHLSVLSLTPNCVPKLLCPGKTPTVTSERACLRASLASDVNRLTHGGSKDGSGENKNKALDENGNALNRVDSGNSNSHDRKLKLRKPKINNDRNVIMSQNIEGHRGDKDLESLISYIESNNDCKGKGTKNATSHSNGPMSFSSKQQKNSTVVSGTKPRREPVSEEERSKNRTSKQMTKEQRKGSKLNKSNSLEEISKTKLEDLTEEIVDSERGNSVLVRRPKKQTIGDDGEFSRVGDRRSWGTEEGHDVTVTVSADESSSSSLPSRKRREERRRSERDEGGVAVTSEETEFLVVVKKQRRKKRRSSSGGRAGVSGTLFSDDSRRSGTVPMYNSHVTTSSSSYYQLRDGNGGSQPYYQRKTFTSSGTGFPPHDRTVEREGGVLYQYRHHRPRSPDHLRRKSTSSMPPSDKSDSSDLDSVHSLPVSSTTPKLTLDQTSTSSGSTPQASYADIARASTNTMPTVPSQPHLNPGRWPAVSAPKSIAPSVPPPLPPSSSTGSTPAPPSNPQFITGGPKLNIGAPPVSGSKVASHTAVPSPPEDSVTPQQREPESSVQPPIADKSRPVLSDPRTKKDAMTNTTMDYKLIPPYSGDEPATSILSEGDYPSLEESLVSCKIDASKLNKNSHNTPFSPDNNVSAVVTLSLTPERCEVSETDAETKRVVEASVEATVVIPRRHSGTGHVSTTSGGKVSGSVRPPVILMDETEQEGTGYGELTFGFEVNEQLLLSESVEDGDDSAIPPPQDEMEEEESPSASEEVAYVSTTVLQTPLPGNSKVGEEFSARYREPTTQADNHDKIVTFVGLAWDDVLKEMNCTPVHPGSKIRYYSGQ